jgi:hypothetical protein
MARQTASRKSNSRSLTKSTPKTRSTTKAPRKSRSSLPEVASRSQNTLTQIRFVPRFGRPDEEELDLEYLELGTETAGGEDESAEAVRVATEPRSSKPLKASGFDRSGGGQKTKQRRKRKLEKDPDNKTLTQIGYVARYTAKNIDVSEDMEYLPRHGQCGVEGILSSVRVQFRHESPLEPVRVSPKSILMLKTRKGRRPVGDQSVDTEEGLYEEATTASKEPKNEGKKVEDLPTPNISTKSTGKRNATYQDASGDAESDYADDESQKRRKKQSVSPASQGPVASRLRSRNTRVSYVDNAVTKDLDMVEKLPRRTHKGTKTQASSKPKTPAKTPRFEIPSSQSPGSTPLSIRSRPPSRPGETSPLRSPLTDLSAYSRMANSSKKQRLGEKSSSVERPFEPQNMWFRNIQQTAGSNNIRDDATNENFPVEQESQTSTITSLSSLPDLETLFGPSRPVTKPSGISAPPKSLAIEPNNDSDDEFEMGTETQAAFYHLDRPGLPNNDDDLNSIHTEEPVDALYSPVAETSGKNPNADDVLSEDPNVSPPWLPEDRFEVMKPSQPSQTLRQSQISTQGIPSSTLGPPTQGALHDPHVSEPEFSIEHASQPPKDLTQIWSCSDSSSSSPSASHFREDAQDKQELQPTPTNPSQFSRGVSQPKARDLTQIWRSSESGSQGVLTASQLLPASMMESLPKPPAWTESQDGFSDGDWL